MGALTLKNFPFELRGWELEKSNGIDLTDSFGSNIKISLNNNQIVQIEPSQNFKNSIWIHDKARQFFDSLNYNLINLKDSDILVNLKNLHRTAYFFDLCNLKYYFYNYLLIVYENISINNLYLLMFYKQKYSFLKIKKSENSLLNNNLEFNFLLNKKMGYKTYNSSSLCLLISTNPRIEGSKLNLILKQRALKGNFKIFYTGSFVDLTYNIRFLGKSVFPIIKSILEGTHFVCQNIKLATNPIIITNTLIFKKYYNLIQLLNKNIGYLNQSLFQTGEYLANKPSILNNNDFLQFSAVYFINIAFNNNIIKILKINMVFYKKFLAPFIKKLNFNQNYYKQKFFLTNYFNKNILNKYLYLPTSTLFETSEKFLTAEGFIKTTKKLVFKKTNFSNWKYLRVVFNNIRKNINQFTAIKSKFQINFKIKNMKLKMFNVLNFESIQLLTKRINKFILNGNNSFFNKTKLLNLKKIKLINSKLKIWLTDFFSGGKEGFSHNSVNLIQLSKSTKELATNYF